MRVLRVCGRGLVDAKSRSRGLCGDTSIMEMPKMVAHAEDIHLPGSEDTRLQYCK
jgi:hypothetical protein